MNSDRIAELARALMIARDNNPMPQTWRKAEAELRAALGLPEPPPLLVKPWET
jgi:predicted RNase H-like nuclease (RuvC/YqgF family)